MKDRAPGDKANSSHAIAHEVGKSGTRPNPGYQIDDRREASIMQRKLRNLANGLVSANIIERRTKPERPSVDPVTVNPKNKS